jgi:hypothetical protein
VQGAESTGITEGGSCLTIGQYAIVYGVTFRVENFDPSTSGLVCVTSDPASDGFIQTDGAVPVEYAREP